MIKTSFWTVTFQSFSGIQRIGDWWIVCNIKHFKILLPILLNTILVKDFAIILVRHCNILKIGHLNLSLQVIFSLIIVTYLLFYCSTLKMFCIVFVKCLELFKVRHIVDVLFIIYFNFIKDTIIFKNNSVSFYGLALYLF